MAAVCRRAATGDARHELRNALRLAVFRKEIDAERRQAAFVDIESDSADGILAQALGAKEFLTLDSRQAELAKAAGFKMKFSRLSEGAVGSTASIRRAAASAQ